MGSTGGSAEELDWRRLLLVGVLCALAAAAGAWCRGTYGARTVADEPQYLLSAISIAEDGDLDISDELAAQRWRAFHEAQLPEQTQPLPDGRRVSPHDPLLPLLLALPMAAGGWLGAKLALAVLAGALGTATAWVAVRRFGVPAGVASLAAVVFGASMPLASYGNQVYPELPAALAAVVAVGALTGPLRRGGVWTLGAAVVALPWLAVKYIPVAAVLALLGLVRLWRTPGRQGDRVAAGGRGSRWVAVGLAGGLAVAGVAFLAFHKAVYTGWTPYAAGDFFYAEGGFAVGRVFGLQPNYVARSQRLAGLLVGRKFGIAAWQPAWLLAVPALGALARARPAGWHVLATTIAVGWLNATFVALTAQGYWAPGRQVVVILGPAVVVIAWWAGRLRAVRLLTALGLLGVASYLWLAVETSVGPLRLIIDWFDTANPIYRAWRWALPDYVAPSAWTWPLHWLWVGLLLGLLVLGWRREGIGVRSP
ncbi:MAG: hypothetical protein ACRDZ4_07700 [Egibacteraceae bacterium]